MPARRGLVVRLGSNLESVLVRVPADRFDLAAVGELVAIGQAGRPLAEATTAGEDYDPTVVPSGSAVAELTSDELLVYSESWEVAARRALRNEQDADRRSQLQVAMGHARVLRALAGDVRSNPPTARDFDLATECGLLTPRRLRTTSPVAPASGSPLTRQLAQADDVARRVRSLGPTEPGRFRSRSSFAGLTTAAALVLTGCGSEPSADDRRCVDNSDRVVGDDNCRTYGGGGVGGYFYRYGGSTYSGSGGTYLRGGAVDPPLGGSGERSSGGGHFFFFHGGGGS